MQVRASFKFQDWARAFNAQSKQIPLCQSDQVLNYLKVEKVRAVKIAREEDSKLSIFFFQLSLVGQVCKGNTSV